MEYFEFKESYKSKTKVTTGCGIPKFFDRCKIVIGIYGRKSKRILSGTVKQRHVHIQKNLSLCNLEKKLGKIVY